MIDNIEPEKQVGKQVWYALRTFNCQEQKVSSFLTDNGYLNFIPMVYSTQPAKDNDEEKEKVLVPAVHNLLFVQKSGSLKQMVSLLKECVVPVSFFRNPGVQQYCEISERDMMEFRLLCDPQFTTKTFVSQSEAEAMIGKEVKVVSGPFKGSKGKLVRKSKQYYFLKVIIGVGVMVRIPRWYCEPI